MAEPKTKRNNRSVTAFLNSIPDAHKRRDAFAISALMRQITNARPHMWGASIVGFGSYSYKYASGREGDWPIIAFSPRKQNLTVYLMPGFEGDGKLLRKLGKYRTGKVCLYINRLDDIHVPTLKELMRRSVRYMANRDK